MAIFADVSLFLLSSTPGVRHTLPLPSHSGLVSGRVESWQWAITKLLPNSSQTTVFNLNRYRVLTDPARFLVDQQSMDGHS